MKNITLFDFDGSIVRQHGLMQALGHRINRIDLLAYRTDARLWTSPALFSELGKRHFEGAESNMAFIGSGDYHHFSLPLIARQHAPLSLVLFDNHPDWMRPPHRYHCGTWVYTAARLPNVVRIVIIGLESGDIAGKTFRSGDMESFSSGKVMLFPATDVEALAPTGRLLLPGCLNDGEESAMEHILNAIPEGNVYISMDKDCLRAEEAGTNWEQGSLSLDFVVNTITTIGKHRRIVGADTVGDASPPRFRSPLKWMGSILDRPQKALSFNVDEETVRRNERANLALVECLDRFL